MQSSMLTLTLTNLFGLTLAIIIAPAVKAQPTADLLIFNPPAEVPSPSLIELDHSSAVNPARPEQITIPSTQSLQPTPRTFVMAPSTKSLLPQRTAVTAAANRPAAMSSPSGQILDPKNTPVEVPSPSLQNHF